MRAVLVTCGAGAGGQGGQEQDASLVAYSLQLPDTTTLSQEMAVVDVEALHAARKRVKAVLAATLRPEFLAAFEGAAPPSAAYTFSAAEVGRRRLRNTCLDYLSAGPPTPDNISRSTALYSAAVCMTERLAALDSLLSKDCPERDAALAAFHSAARGDALVLNKWFALQAAADAPALLSKVKALKAHPDFLLSNPNRARSLISTFAANMPHFHARDGQGYAFVADSILELDKLNPQVASRLTTAFSQWRRYDAGRQALMRAQLERIGQAEGLSKDTFEIVARSLK